LHRASSLALLAAPVGVDEKCLSFDCNVTRGCWLCLCGVVKLLEVVLCDAHRQSPSLSATCAFAVQVALEAEEPRQLEEPLPAS
jgi:hypothetical protein